MKTVLEQLREMTVVVADTGEAAAVKEYKPLIVQQIHHWF